MSRQPNPFPYHLPDFANLGVMARAIAFVNIMAVLTVLLGNRNWALLPKEMGDFVIAVEIPLLLIMSILFALARTLERIRPQWLAAGAVVVLVMVTILLMQRIYGWPMLAVPDVPEAQQRLRMVLWTLFASVLCLFYFYLLDRLRSPALTEARLMALSARIRPHFLFNTLNGVLGILRQDPRRAESALEELAELFREAMQENLQLVPLGREVALTKRYLNLEKLRLGDRLNVDWACDEQWLADENLKVPAMLLQPLLENAVYHGVEPFHEPSTITVKISKTAVQLVLDVANPLNSTPTRRSAGNRIALNNIQQRLQLFYDIEATLTYGPEQHLYRVVARIPLRQPRLRGISHVQEPNH